MGDKMIDVDAIRGLRVRKFQNSPQNWAFQEEKYND